MWRAPAPKRQPVPAHAAAGSRQGRLDRGQRDLRLGPPRRQGREDLGVGWGSDSALGRAAFVRPLTGAGPRERTRLERRSAGRHHSRHWRCCSRCVCHLGVGRIVQGIRHRACRTGDDGQAILLTVAQHSEPAPSLTVAASSGRCWLRCGRERCGRGSVVGKVAEALGVFRPPSGWLPPSSPYATPAACPTTSACSTDIQLNEGSTPDADARTRPHSRFELKPLGAPQAGSDVSPLEAEQELPRLRPEPRPSTAPKHLVSSCRSVAIEPSPAGRGPAQVGTELQAALRPPGSPDSI